MSPRAKKDAEVEVVEATPIQVGDVSPVVTPPARTTNTANAEEPSEEDISLTEEQATEEFNNHVRSLVRLFHEQEIQGLEQRITDLENTVAGLLGVTANPDEPVPYVPVPLVPNSIPDYAPEHQSGDGVPWFQG